MWSMQNLNMSTYVEGLLGQAFEGRASFAKRSREILGKKFTLKEKIQGQMQEVDLGRVWCF